MQNNPDILIVESKKDISKAIKEDLLKKNWKKITENIFEGFGFYTEFSKSKNAVKIRVYVKDQWDNILNSKFKIYGFFLVIGLRSLIKRIIRIIKNTDVKANIRHTFED